MSRQARPITRWNIAALLIMVIGVAMSWFAGQYSLQRWAQSGEKMPVGEWSAVDLPEGDLIVYYESRIAVPGNSSMLSVRGPDGGLLPPRRVNRGAQRASGEIAGLSIEDLFIIDIRQPGQHQLFLLNSSYDPDQLPADDRITVLKVPRTLAAALERRQTVMLIGGSVTGTLAIICYILHFRLLLMRRVGRLLAAAETVAAPVSATPGPDSRSAPVP